MKQLNYALKNTAQLTDEQEDFIKNVLAVLKRGDLHKQIIAKCKTAIEDMGANVSPLKITACVQANVSESMLRQHMAADQYQSGQPREVVLSMYIKD